MKQKLSTHHRSGLGGRLGTIIAIALCLLAVCSSTLADTIRLKDGSVYKGKVTSYQQRKFTITIYVGSSSSQHTVPVEDIESIEFDGDTGAQAALKAAVPETKPLPPAPRTAEPATVTATPPVETPSPKSEPVANEPTPAPPASTPTASANTGEPLMEKNINIAAAADWTSTEIRVQRGQRIFITASGEVDLGSKGRSTPAGIPANDPKRLMPGQPTGGLIAVIGDDNNDFVFIGTEGEFVAKTNGVLFLSVNEEKLDDNRGSYVARIKILPR